MKLPLYQDFKEILMDVGEYSSNWEISSSQNQESKIHNAKSCTVYISSFSTSVFKTCQKGTVTFGSSSGWAAAQLGSALRNSEGCSEKYSANVQLEVEFNSTNTDYILLVIFND